MSPVNMVSLLYFKELSPVCLRSIWFHFFISNNYARYVSGQYGFTSLFQRTIPGMSPVNMVFTAVRPAFSRLFVIKSVSQNAMPCSLVAHYPRFGLTASSVFVDLHCFKYHESVFCSVLLDKAYQNFCSLTYPACKAYVPCCDVICGPSGSNIFFDIIS